MAVVSPANDCSHALLAVAGEEERAEPEGGIPGRRSTHCSRYQRRGAQVGAAVPAAASLKYCPQEAAQSRATGAQPGKSPDRTGNTAANLTLRALPASHVPACPACPAQSYQPCPAWPSPNRTANTRSCSPCCTRAVLPAWAATPYIHRMLDATLPCNVCSAVVAAAASAKSAKCC